MVEVDIANLALGFLGDGATIASLDPPEGSAQAQHAARFYPLALQNMLEAHQWNFITKRVALAEVATDYAGWQYAYALPSDCADIISVLPQEAYQAFYCQEYAWSPWGYQQWWGGLPYVALQIEQSYLRDFQVETYTNGQQVILSNSPSAIGRYTTTQVQPGNFPAQFTTALAYELASFMAGPLIKGDAGAQKSKEMLGFAQVWQTKAMVQDANQRKGNQQPVPSGILARL